MGNLILCSKWQIRISLPYYIVYFWTDFHIQNYPKNDGKIYYNLIFFKKVNLMNTLAYFIERVLFIFAITWEIYEKGNADRLTSRQSKISIVLHLESIESKINFSEKNMDGSGRGAAPQNV